MRSLPRQTGTRRPFPQSMERQLVASPALLLAALRRFFLDRAATHTAMACGASSLSKGIGEDPGIQTGVMPVEHVSGARLRLMGRGPDRSIHGKTSIDGELAR
jgi:hypothetical protein